MLPWRRPEPSPEEEGVLWGHLARVGARRRPAQPSFELVYSLSVCQLFRLSRFVPDFDVSGKTAEPKMAFNFAHLLSAACGGAPRRLGRLRRPPGRWQHVHAAAGARYTTGALWRAPGEHDYAVVASTRERVASIFTKTLGVPSAASIRSGVTVLQQRRPRNCKLVAIESPSRS